MIAKDCTSLVQLVSFIEKVTGTSTRSGWYLDRYFTTSTTEAEKLELRRYMRGNVLPLFYSGACQPPHLVKTATASITVKELEFPTLRAEANIDCKDVEEHRVSNTGDFVPQRQRYQEAVNWGMRPLIEGLRNTHISEAVNSLGVGGYVLNDSLNSNVGTVDFCREDSLKDIDLSGTDYSWDKKCAKPFKSIESILREMARCNGVAGQIDVIYSELAWEWMEAHSEREAIKFRTDPAIPTGFNSELSAQYDDVLAMGQTRHGGLIINHFVNHATYLDHEGNEVSPLAPGEIKIVTQAFGGQRIFRTVSSDRREYLPSGIANPFFLYDDPNDPEVYNRKCRAYKPWIEVHHLLVPRNVNGAAKLRVVPETSTNICFECETCP